MLLAIVQTICVLLLLETSAGAAGSVSVSCPKSNGTTYTASNGDEFVIECKFDRTGGDLEMKYTNTFQDCIDLCSSTTNCVDISYSGTACYMKDVLKDGHSAGCSGARLVPPTGSQAPSSKTSSSVASGAASSYSTASPTSASSSTAAGSSTTTSNAKPTATTTSGCSKPLPYGLVAGGSSRSVNLTTTSGTTRNYLLYVPSSYSATTPNPLILSFHGHGGSPGAQESLTGFSTSSVNPDHIVAYPAGVDASWQGAPYASPGIDDIAFTTELLANLGTTLCVDASRRYATGHSNGGGFVGTLACSASASSSFAAFAASSGAFYQNDTNTASCNATNVPLLPCHPSLATSGKAPFLEVHGTADATIPYWGGAHMGECMPSVPGYMAAWATREGWPGANESQAVTTTSGKATTQYNWNEAGTVVHYRVEGLGHDWATNWGGFSTSPTIMSWLKKWSI